MTTIYPDAVVPSSLNYTPLTTDNLKKKGQYDSDAHVPPTLLERYCQDILTASPRETPKRQKQRSTSSTRSKSRPSSQRRQSSSIKSSTSTARDNTVMESPRLLPFPYHNDSLFLPTVEQHRRMERAKSVASIKSSTSFGNHHHHLHLANNDLITAANNTNTSNIPSTLSSDFSSSLPPPRRQSSAPPATPSKRRRMQPQRLDHASTQPLTAERLSSPRRPSKNKTTTKSPSSWLQMIWRLLKKSARPHRFSTKTVVSVVS